MIRISTLLAATLAATGAQAGGFTEPPAPLPPLAPAPSQDWTGAYAGVQLDFILDGTDVGVGTNAEFDGTLYGIFGGYRYDFGTFVLGGEIDYMIGSGDYQPIAVGVVALPPQDIDFETLIRVGVEAGYDAGQTLIYGTAGYAHLEFETDGASLDGDGFFYGIGMDFRVNDSFTVGAELLQHEFDDLAQPGNDIEALTFG